jgi:hypothetical protein
MYQLVEVTVSPFGKPEMDYETDFTVRQVAMEFDAMVQAEEITIVSQSAKMTRDGLIVQFVCRQDMEDVTWTFFYGQEA